MFFIQLKLGCEFTKKPLQFGNIEKLGKKGYLGLLVIYLYLVKL